MIDHATIEKQSKQAAYRPSLEAIRARVEKHTGLDLSKRCRRDEYVIARAAYYLVSREQDYRCQQIGELIGYDHASVVHASKNTATYKQAFKTFVPLCDAVRRAYPMDEQHLHRRRDYLRGELKEVERLLKKATT